MDLGDVRGMHGNHSAPMFLGGLGTFVGVVCPHFSLEALRNYPQRDGQRSFDVLRELLSVPLGVSCWIEVAACRSFLQYRALNVYWSLRTPSDGHQAPSWWLVNWREPPRYRRQVHPTKWHQCLDYLWVGRAEIHADYVLRTLRLGWESGASDDSYRMASSLAEFGVSLGIIQPPDLVFRISMPRLRTRRRMT